MGQREVPKEVNKCIKANESENTTCQKLWDSTKVGLRGKFKVINIYIKNSKGLKSKI
jgi:hypothetical protein